MLSTPSFHLTQQHLAVTVTKMTNDETDWNIDTKKVLVKGTIIGR